MFTDLWSSTWMLPLLMILMITSESCGSMTWGKLDQKNKTTTLSRFSENSWSSNPPNSPSDLPCPNQPWHTELPPGGRPFTGEAAHLIWGIIGDCRRQFGVCGGVVVVKTLLGLELNQRIKNLVMCFILFLKGVHKQMAASCGVPFGLALSLPRTGGWCCRNCLLSALTSGES